jgi:hypothetical protein
MNKMVTFFPLIYFSNPVYFLTYNLFTVKELDDYRCYATNIVGTGSSNQGFLDVSGREFKAFSKKKKKRL